MAFDFPSSPTDGQTYAPAGGPTYIWRAAKTAWEVYTTTPGGLATTSDVLTGTDASKVATPDAIAALWEMAAGIATAANVTIGEGGYGILTGAGTVNSLQFAIKKDGRRLLLYLNTTGIVLKNGVGNAGTGIMLIPGGDYTATAGDVIEFVQSSTNYMIAVNILRTGGRYVVGPASAAADGDIAVFDGLTGKLIKSVNGGRWLGSSWQWMGNFLWVGSYPTITLRNTASSPNLEFSAFAHDETAFLDIDVGNVRNNSALVVRIDALNQVAIAETGSYLVGPANAAPTGGSKGKGTLNTKGLFVEGEPAEVQRGAFKNRIINGDFSIDQRNGGAAALASNGAGWVFTADRWNGVAIGAGSFYMQQVADPNFLGENYVSIAANAKDDSLAAGDLYLFNQHIEGNHTQGFNWGNGNAKSVVVSFDAWLSTGGPATLAVSVRNADGSRSWLGSVTVTTSIQRFVLVVPGDTTGTWDKALGIGVSLGFSVAAGSTYQGVAGWQAGNKTTLAGATNFMATGAPFLRLARVQVEIGAFATNFERVAHADNWARCKRYYQRWTGNLIGYANGGTAIGQFMRLEPGMRTNPTIGHSGGTLANCGSMTDDQISYQGFRSYAVITSTGTGYADNVIWSANAEL